MLKRTLDIVVSTLTLLVLAPVMLTLAVVVKLDSRGPVLFRQERVGRFGKPFYIHKFRTMVIDAELKGLQITVSEDVRITASGHWMRKYKLDELPQFLDVLLGRMSLVGPRPEVPRYVACYPVEIREIVLSVRPGITDIASIVFKDENKILNGVVDPDKAYINEVLPVKLKFNVEYVSNHSFIGDVRILLKTFKAIFL